MWNASVTQLESESTAWSWRRGFAIGSLLSQRRFRPAGTVLCACFV
jgi:hypothetical protein